jgi:hypothetical protein
MRFTKRWVALPVADGDGPPVPVLAVYLRAASRRPVRELFIVDSGADLSMAPRRRVQEK